MSYIPYPARNSWRFVISQLQAVQSSVSDLPHLKLGFMWVPLEAIAARTPGSCGVPILVSPYLSNLSTPCDSACTVNLEPPPKHKTRVRNSASCCREVDVLAAACRGSLVSRRLKRARTNHIIINREWRHEGNEGCGLTITT